MFAPFHYGYWDGPDGAEERHPTAANELTITEWDLYLLTSLTEVTWMMVKQAAEALRDEELLEIVTTCEHDVDVQLHWLQTRMKQAAPQALIAAS